MSFSIQMLREVSEIETRQNSSLGIMEWGKSNSFPQTLINLIDKSANAKPVVSRTAKFYKGAGFDGEDEIVNPYGLTLKKVVSIMADDYATFEAFALHVNYNLKGKVTSIQPMRISELRFNEFDELNYSSKIGYHRNFGRNAVAKKNIEHTVNKDNIKWFDRFYPALAIQQAEKVNGGLGNYNGQLLYHSETGHSSYPVPPLQAPINFVLSDVENGILVRKETSTGFISSYILKTTMDAEEPTLIALQNSLEEAQGARGTGKVVLFSGIPQADLAGTTLEEIGSGGSGAKTVVEASKITYELAKDVISGAYLIPPALAGVDRKTGFSGEDLKESYIVFNAVTQGGRDIIESELNRVLEHSIFKTRNIKIKKLTMDLEEEMETGADNVTENKK